MLEVLVTEICFDFSNAKFSVIIVLRSNASLKPIIVSGTRTCRFILRLPYLIVKKEEAKVMLNFCESRLRRRGKPYTRNEWAWYQALSIFNS